MATVYDVASHILEHAGPMTAMKLQKLVYYSHAWHLVWESKPLFASSIEAWANGPVVPDLYNEHRGQFRVENIALTRAPELSPEEISSIEAVIGHYGKKTPFELSELTHREDPWKNAREGLAAGQRSNNVITDASMAEYYEGLLATF